MLDCNSCSEHSGQMEKIISLTEEMKDHTKRLSDIEKNFVANNVLVQQFTEITKEHSQTMSRVEKTMLHMSYNLESNGENIKTLNGKVDKLGEKVDGEFAKNKIDIFSQVRDEAKNKLSGKAAYAGIGAGLTAIVGIIYEVIKNLPK